MEQGLNINYLKAFYSFLYFKKGKDFLLFILAIFITSLLPYILVASTLNYDNDQQLKNFYGDGSILTLCIGILISYYTVFLGFRKRESRSEESQEKNSNNIDNSILVIVLFIVYAIVVWQFYTCQTSIRNWAFIFKIFTGSGLLLSFTILVASYLHFREDVSYSDVQNFSEERKRVKMKKEVDKTFETEDGVGL